MTSPQPTSYGEESLQKPKNEDDLSNVLISSLDDQAKWIQSLSETEGNNESPIDINLSHSIVLDLNPLKWHYMDLLPKKMKLTNTGHTLILSAIWHQEKPFLSGGPFTGCYLFSQLHFHWGRNDMEGSEHTIDGSKHPFEMHAVHFNSCYETQEAALKEKGGVAVLVYLFKAQPNPAIQLLVDSILSVQKPHCSVRLDSTALQFFMRQFTSDYFLYWGSMTTTTCVHIILWLISRVPIGISADQIEAFRSLMDINEDPLTKNCRNVQPRGTRRLFHISPGGSRYSTLLPIPRDEK